LPEHARALADVGRRLREVGYSSPAFCFGGRAFAANPALAETIPGEYLSCDARTAVAHLKKRLED
jgi:hypothetical protein